MKVKELIESWQQQSAEPRTNKEYCVRLPIRHAARLAALAEIYAGRTQEQIIIELLGVVLDEVAGAFPYVQGTKIIGKDECDDPLYEDVGPTPRFHALTQKYLQLLEQEAKVRD